MQAESASEAITMKYLKQARRYRRECEKIRRGRDIKTFNVEKMYEMIHK